MTRLRSLLVISLLASTGCQDKDGPSPASGQANAQIGQPAPELAGKTIDGKPVDLAGFRGQVVLVNVWATWCKPCNKELPELVKLHAEHQAQGFSVLGVSVDRQQALHKVRGTTIRYQLQYPMLFDPGSRAIAPWSVTGYPTSFLIGRDGTIRWRRNGIIHPEDGELARQLARALAEPAS